ncbi:MAG: hypothetical protein KGR26_06980, partial [Cyanobacteria bacterium REEB65]|nr:hypothetical protein [Cyanobacteria bacterium REEB65]
MGQAISSAVHAVRTPDPVETAGVNGKSSVRLDPIPYRVQTANTETFVSGTGTDPGWGGFLVYGNQGWDLDMIPGAEWIWDTTALDNGGTATFSRTFTISPSAYNLTGYVDYGFDDWGSVIVNGQIVANGGTWAQPSRVVITQFLHTGSNLITLIGHNRPCSDCYVYSLNPAGVIARVTAAWEVSSNQLAGHFTPDTVEPLKDRQESFGDAQTTTLVVEAPASVATVHLAATVDPHSGGHDHDASERPVGEFLLPDGTKASQTDFALTNGYGRIAYRCSGFGGTDIVTI